MGFDHESLNALPSKGTGTQYSTFKRKSRDIYGHVNLS